ncbi:MAG: hypothetical protein K0S47_4056 [Herbinix sp.]|jgi:hypothetical protein|nr:hypothetical protein [Herbinix sp.]
MYDQPFLETVAAKLAGIDRMDVAEQYNAWYAAWKVNDITEMKKVAEWYREEVDRKFEKWKKEQQEKAVEDWKEKRITLLKLKRELLLSMKS